MSADTPSTEQSSEIKCLVWDLDDTLWSGTLAEGDAVTLRPECEALIRTLDGRGILQSIASRNDAQAAWEQLQSFGLDAYFLYPQIHWQHKSASIQQIAQALNIGLDAIAFVDDQAYEREEVRFHLPEVRVMDADLIPTLAARPEFNPSCLSDEARKRRERYQTDQRRQQAEASFQGKHEAFLRSLCMKLQISRASEQDLDRLHELTQRTHQLNTTGITFSPHELRTLLHDATHELWVLTLDDRFGTYGKIGVVLVEKHASEWCIRLLLLSCRVMSRGIGSPLISWLQNQALNAGVALTADFLPTDRNRTMYLTYKLAGFEEIDSTAQPLKLRCNLDQHIPLPDYLRIDVLNPKAPTNDKQNPSSLKDSETFPI